MCRCAACPNRASLHGRRPWEDVLERMCRPQLSSPTRPAAVSAFGRSAGRAASPAAERSRRPALCRCVVSCLISEGAQRRAVISLARRARPDRRRAGRRRRRAWSGSASGGGARRRTSPSPTCRGSTPSTRSAAPSAAAASGGGGGGGGETRSPPFHENNHAPSPTQNGCLSHTATHMLLSAHVPSCLPDCRDASSP